MKPGTETFPEYRMLFADNRTATASIFAYGLGNTTLLQLARLITGVSQAFSVYAVYREGEMTFEASARVAVARPSQSLESIMRAVIRDDYFLSALLAPLAVQVRQHFALESENGLG